MSLEMTDGQLAVVARVFGVIEGMVPKDTRLYLFGSFARQETRTSSDIDIAIDAGDALPFSQLAEIRDALEESSIPYTVDVVDMWQVGDR